MSTTQVKPKLYNNGTFRIDGTSVLETNDGYWTYVFISSMVNNIMQSMCIKLGDTTVGVAKRIEQWRIAKELYSDIFLLWKKRNILFPDNDPFKPIMWRDHSYHKALSTLGYKRIVDIMDGLDISVEHCKLGNLTQEQVVTLCESIYQDIVDNYNNPASPYTYMYADNTVVVNHYERSKTFQPRAYQQEVIDKVYGYFHDRKPGHDYYLISAPTRSGKTFMSIHAAKKLTDNLDKSITLVVSGKADVMDEWKSGCESHVDFSKFTFLTKKSFDHNENIVDELYKDNNHIMVFFTLQDLYGSNKDQGVKAAHKFIKNYPIDLILSDEAHFAGFTPDGKYNKIFTDETMEDFYVDTESSLDKKIATNVSKILGKINPTIGTIFITATPYNVMFSDTWNFTYKNMTIITEGGIQEENKKWFVENPDLPGWKSPYFGIPHKHNFVIPLGATAGDFFKLDNGEFAHGDKVEHLFDGMFGAGNEIAPCIFMDVDYRDAQLGKGIMITVEQKSAADQVEDMLINIISKYGLDYNVINISSKRGNTYSNLTTAQIKNKISELNERFIIITCNKMLTGVTIEKLDTIVIARTMKSAQEFMQTAGRAGSPYVVNTVDDDGKEQKICMKEHASIICFDPYQMVEVVQERISYEANHKNNADGDEFSKLIDRDLQYNPVYVLDASAVEKLHKMDSTDIVSYMRKYSHNKSLGDLINNSGFNIDLTDSEVISVLDTVEVFSKKKSSLNINIFSNEIDTDSPAEQCKVKDCMSNHIDNSMFCAEHTRQEKDALDDLSKKKNSENKEERKEANNKIKEILSMRKIYAEKAAMFLELFYLYAVLNRDEDITSMRTLIESIQDEKNSELVELLGINIDYAVLLYKKKCYPRDADFGFQEIEHMFNQTFDRVFDNYAMIFKTVDKLSNNEIITSERVADMLIEHIDFSVLPAHGIIDPAAKSGVFLVRCYEKYLENGFTHKDLKDKLYCIPTGGISYAIIRDLYQQYGWNTDNILFNKDVSCLDMNKYLAEYMNNGKVEENSMVDNMFNAYLQKDILFDYSISNPPYQINIKKRTLKVYPKFFLQSIAFSNVTIMIFPRGWIYSRGSGQIYDAQYMQNLSTIRHIDIYTEDADSPIRIFKEGTGGVSIVVNDNHCDNTIDNGIEYSYNTVDQGKVNKNTIFVQSKNMKPEFIGIINKVQTYPSVMHIISGQTRYGIRSTKTKSAKYVYSIKRDNTVRLFSNDGVERWVDKDKVNMYSTYKLTMPSTGTYRQHRDSFIMNKDEVCDDTYITVEFSTLKECKNYQKYMGTKLYQFLLKLGTVSHNATRSTHQYAPDLQDYTDNNPDINWDEPLDPQLYALFHLSEDEIATIEKGL